MADAGDADILEVVGRQLRQDLDIDFVVAKRGLVLLEAEISQPLADIHGWPHIPFQDNRSVVASCPALPLIGSAKVRFSRSSPVRRADL